MEQELSEKTRIINEIFRSYVEKDIAYFLGINRADAFILLIRLLASQTGQIIRYSKISQESGISFPTLKNYLWYAEKTFSIRTVQPYFKNKHKEITKSPSVYFCDIGLRNFSLGLFGSMSQPQQRGFIFQNLVANKLHEENANTAKSLHFWRTLDRAEVDFVINEGESIIPVEVKYAKLQKPQITRSMGNFIKAYSPKEARVINLSLEDEIKIGNTAVKFIPYWMV